MTLALWVVPTPLAMRDGGPTTSGDVTAGSETGAVDPYAENFCGYGDNIHWLSAVLLAAQYKENDYSTHAWWQ